MSLEVVLPDGQIAVLGGAEDETPGLDRGAFVGSEGTLGIATKIGVRITPNAPAVRTLLLSFATVRDAIRPSATSSPPASYLRLR